MTTLIVRGPALIGGTTTVPGDRSISHRALLLGAMASGRTTVANIGPGEDVVSMIRCLQSYGVQIDRSNGSVEIDGMGLRGWTRPADTLDCGNSGATMRMLAGCAAHYDFVSILDGDQSLRRRPMDRVATPLRVFGAHVETTDGHAPLRVSGGRLTGASVETSVASAQVKSSAIFAAIAADGPTTVVEPRRSRDHTERMLEALGASIKGSDLPDGSHRVDVEPFEPAPFHVEVAGDVSSAAFLVAAGVLGGRIVIGDVGLNPTRTGFVASLRDMGADVAVTPSADRLLEPIGVIEARRSALRAISIADAGPEIHDELPLIALLATQAKGETVVRGASELRVKESDRIASLIEVLRPLGADIEPLPDGFVVVGPTRLSGSVVSSGGDHRIAMCAAIAALVAEGETRVEDFGCASVSWPGFERVLSDLGADVELV